MGYMKMGFVVAYVLFTNLNADFVATHHKELNIGTVAKEFSFALFYGLRLCSVDVLAKREQKLFSRKRHIGDA